MGVRRSIAGSSTIRSLTMLLFVCWLRVRSNFMRYDRGWFVIPQLHWLPKFRPASANRTTKVQRTEVRCARSTALGTYMTKVARWVVRNGHKYFDHPWLRPTTSPYYLPKLDSYSETIELPDPRSNSVLSRVSWMGGRRKR